MNFKKSFSETCDVVSADLGSRLPEEYITKIESEIERVVQEITSIGSTRKSIQFIKGDIAEPWHEGTLSIDATAKGLNNIYTFAPRNSSPVDIWAISATDFVTAQLKYYKTPKDTAKAISLPKYEGMVKIVPSNQLEGVKEALHRMYLENIEKRPEMAAQYYSTYERVVDRLNFHGAESHPLSEKEALQIAKEIQKENFDPNKHGLTSLDFIQFSDAFRVCGEAAFNAAILTTVFKIAPHLVTYLLKIVREEKIEISALSEALTDVKSGIIFGTLRGSVAASITLACRSGLLGLSFKNISPSTIGGAPVIALKGICHAISLYKKEIDIIEFTDLCLHDVFVVSFGICGATIGQSLIPIPLLGAVIGNFFGSIMATVVHEGGKQIFLSFCINSGLSFFNIVKQDHSIPPDILQRCGIELISLNELIPETMNLDQMILDTINIDKVSIRPIRRGLIAVNTIGYM